MATNPDRNIAALTTLFLGVTSAATLLCFATGRQKEGYIIGISSAIVGAITGAVRVLAEET